jgi:hypothetical protein
MFLRKKIWDSDFFGRDFYELKAESVEDVHEASAQFEKLDSNGVFGIECQIDIRNLEAINHLEKLGFFLVDSRMEFMTHTFRGDKSVSAPIGEFRRYEDQDWEELAAITIKNFVDNPHFKSRYTNRDIFSREESVRYYLQWHKWVLDVSPDLFLSWVDGEKYVGFYSLLRQPDAEHVRPRYKVGLLAVDEEYHSHNGQNLMQAWLFRETPDTDWTTVTTPSLANTPRLKNNIRTGQEFKTVQLFFFRKNPQLSAD